MICIEIYFEINIIKAEILRSFEEVRHSVLPLEGCIHVIRQTIPVLDRFWVLFAHWRVTLTVKPPVLTPYI